MAINKPPKYTAKRRPADLSIIKGRWHYGYQTPTTAIYNCQQCGANISVNHPGLSRYTVDEVGHITPPIRCGYCGHEADVTLDGWGDPLDSRGQ